MTSEPTGLPLLIISYPPKPADVLESIVFRLCAPDCGITGFGFCPSPDALAAVVGRLSAGVLVDRLDVVGHGAPGVLRLGDEDLGPEVLEELAGHLNDDATLRLLGCQSGLSRGRGWVQD